MKRIVALFAILLTLGLYSDFACGQQLPASVAYSSGGFLASQISGGLSAVTGAIKGNGAGVFTQAACEDLSDSGTMCNQAANAVAITGGSGAFTTGLSYIPASGNATVNVGAGGVGATGATLALNGGSASNGGAVAFFEENSSVLSAIGIESGIFGGSSTNTALYAATGKGIDLFTNGSQVMAIPAASMTPGNILVVNASGVFVPVASPSPLYPTPSPALGGFLTGNTNTAQPGCEFAITLVNGAYTSQNGACFANMGKCVYAQGSASPGALTSPPVLLAPDFKCGIPSPGATQVGCVAGTNSPGTLPIVGFCYS